jgi:hypothetical protein
VVAHAGIQGVKLSRGRPSRSAIHSSGSRDPDSAWSHNGEADPGGGSKEWKQATKFMPREHGAGRRRWKRKSTSQCGPALCSNVRLRVGPAPGTLAAHASKTDSRHLVAAPLARCGGRGVPAAARRHRVAAAQEEGTTLAATADNSRRARTGRAPPTAAGVFDAVFALACRSSGPRRTSPGWTSAPPSASTKSSVFTTSLKCRSARPPFAPAGRSRAAATGSSSLHDGSLFGGVMHRVVMPAVALTLLGLTVTGYAMWLWPKWRRWRGAGKAGSATGGAGS